MAGEPLPKGWQWTTLGTVANFVNGDRGENYPTQSDRVGIGVPFINTGHIEPNGRLVSTGMDYITRGSFERLRSGKVNPGDIFYCLRGSTIGKTARNHFTEGAIASSLVIVRAKENACQEYLYFYLISPLGRGLVAQHDNGSAQPNLSVRSLSNYPLPLPPVDEQRAIAHILGTLDDKIELNRRRNVTLEAMAHALFQDWFVDFGPVRAKLEGRTPYLPSDLWNRFPVRLDDDGKPEGWELPRIGDIGSVVCGKTPSTKVLEYFGEDVPFITIPEMHGKTFATDVKRRLSYVGANSQAKKMLPTGSICVSCIGTPGLVVITTGPSQTNQQINAVIPIEKNTTYFWYWALRNLGEDIKASGSGGSVLSNLSTGRFSELRISASTAALRYAYHLNVKDFFEKILAIDYESSALAQLRDTLLPKLISGELRIADAARFAERVL